MPPRFSLALMGKRDARVMLPLPAKFGDPAGTQISAICSRALLSHLDRAAKGVFAVRAWNGVLRGEQPQRRWAG